MGEQLRPTALVVALEAIQNRVMENRKRGKYTWVFLDEVYLYFKYKYSGEILYDEILEWAQLYDNCSIPMKKVIVANMIDRVDVFRDYQLTIRLNITIEQFLIGLENVA